jgi:hypothetical protein
MAIPQIDQALQAILPPKSKLKVQRLIDLAIDLEAAFQALIQRQERLREELGLLRSQQAQAVERARQVTTAPEAAEAAAKEYDSAIKELEGEIERLNKDRAKRCSDVISSPHIGHDVVVDYCPKVDIASR